MRLGPRPYAQEVRDRAVEMYWSDPTASCATIARAIGCSEESVRRWVHQAGPHAANRLSRLAGDAGRDLAARVRGIEVALADLERNVVALLAGPEELRVLF